jgi:MFS family permease
LTQSVEARAPSPSQIRFVTKWPVYYGWIILAAAVVGLIMTSPGQTYSVSIFIERFITDLGISRSVVSTLYMVGTLTASFALPFVGRQLDKRGPQIVVGAITVLFALACVYMSFVQNAVMLGIGFVFIRMLGQGSLSMVSSNVINQWWVQRRGMILGIGGVVASVLGSGMFPSLIHALIGQFGWRSSYRILGLMVAVVMLPVGLIFYRRRPEDFGLLPDGAKASSGDGESTRPRFIEDHWTSTEATRTTTFWILSMGLASISALSTGLQFHMVSIFADANLAASVAAAAFMPIAITNAIGRLGAGTLVDRIPARFLLLSALVCQAISLVMATLLTGTTTALIYGIILGLTGALQMTVSTVVWAKYFGRRHLGSITGIASLISVAGSALGPMPMGIARDLLGSYNLTLTILAALPLALAVAVFFTPQPRRLQTQ